MFISHQGLGIDISRNRFKIGFIAADREKPQVLQKTEGALKLYRINDQTFMFRISLGFFK